MQNNTIPTDLGTERIGKLLRRYALPAIIAMTASSLYNMVDSIFIGQGCGPMAIAGLAITFPLMNLSTAFGSMVGVGASTLISVLLGQRNYDEAGKVLGNVLIMNIAIGLVFMGVTLTFLDPILRFFGASETTLPYAKEYMTVILAGNVITHLYFGLNAVLRAAGYPRKSMTATIITVTLNVILDPIFIFVFDLGIKGAAIATVISQAVSLCLQLHHFSNRNEFLHFTRGKIRFEPKIAGRAVSIGLSPFLMNVASCMVVIFINKGLQSYGGGQGDLCVGAYGIANRIVFLFIMIVLGFNQGMQPIAGYNYGARQYGRVLNVYKRTAISATLVLTASFLTALLIPELAVRLFTSDDELVRLGAKCFRYMVAVFPIVGFQMVTTNLFQSLGMAGKAIFLSLTRQLLFLLPAVLILPRFYGVEGVMMSFPLSDALATVTTGAMAIGLIRKFKADSLPQIK